MISIEGNLAMSIKFSNACTLRSSSLGFWGVSHLLTGYNLCLTLLGLLGLESVTDLEAVGGGGVISRISSTLQGSY